MKPYLDQNKREAMRTDTTYAAFIKLHVAIKKLQREVEVAFEQFLTIIVEWPTKLKK